MGISYFLVHKSMPGTNVSCFLLIFHLFWLLEALQGFARLWEVLEGFGKFWEALEGSAGFTKFCKSLGGFVGQS